MTARTRLIPIIVACPLFLQNLDTSIMGTALPSIAGSLHVDARHLNVAITSYLLSLAIFLPASSWFADKFGARTVFCAAIALFSFASALCGLATSLPQLVLFRVIQGMGGAMMVPVGRLILLRSIPREDMVAAMVWFTVPGAVARVAGPLLGGIVVTMTSWRWIFLLNIPFGILGLIMARCFIQETHERTESRLDLPGIFLISIALVGLVGGLDTIGREHVPQSVTIALTCAGALALCGYLRHTRRVDNPAIDPGLLSFRAYRTLVAGGMPLRVAMGAAPFLLPLMLQLGFGLSPLTSGLLTVGTALGSLSVRGFLKYVIHRFGFKAVLIGSTSMTGLFYSLYGLFRPDTDHTLIFSTLVLGGLFNAMAMISLNTLGYSDVPAPRMSQATALSSIAQQLSLSIGVALGAFLLTFAGKLHGRGLHTIAATDFSLAFTAIGMLTWSSLFFFFQLSEEDGAELRQTRV